MLLNKAIQEMNIGKQHMLAIGNQQRGLNLRRVGIQLAALMAEQRIHRRHPDTQQRKQGDVEFGDVAQLHQRGFTALQPQTLERRGQVIHLLIELTIAVLLITVDNGDGVAVGVTGNQVG